MKAWQHWMIWAAMTGFTAATPRLLSQTTYTDNFNTKVNYLTNGVAGTIWDGIYLGAGEIANATSIGAAAGTVSAADADISRNNVLTLSSLQTVHFSVRLCHAQE
jgi:hypothetical protein